jgi:signal transduction histidine kinase
VQNIHDFIISKLKKILLKTLTLVTIVYFFVLLVVVFFVQNKTHKERQSSVSNTLDMTYWYLIREIGENKRVLDKTIQQIKENYNVNVYTTSDIFDFEKTQNLLCDGLKNFFFHNFSCAIKKIEHPNKQFYIIYFVKNDNFLEYIYFSSLFFLFLVMLTYFLFSRFINIKHNFSRIILDEKKSRIIVDKVLNDQLEEAKKIRDEIKIENFLFTYDLAINSKMKLSLKTLAHDEIEKKIHDLNKEIAHVIKSPFDCVSDYVDFLKKVKERFFDHNSNQYVDIKALITEKISILQSIGYVVECNLQDMNIIGNKYILHKIFVNIFSNVIEHASEKIVNISSFKNEDSFIIKVKNFGSFVPNEKYETIFTKNYTSKPFNFKFCGSGLYDIKNSLLILGGNISVNSNAGENLRKSWTEFSITIPCYFNENHAHQDFQNNIIPTDIVHPECEDSKNIIIVIDDDPSVYQDLDTVSSKYSFVFFSHFDAFFDAIDSNQICTSKIKILITDYYFDKVSVGMNLFSNDYIGTLKDIYEYKGKIILSTYGSFHHIEHIDAIIQKSQQNIHELLINI